MGEERNVKSLRDEATNRWLVPGLLLAATGCLITGQVLPGVTIEFINRDPERYSVMGGVIDLWRKSNPFLAVVLFSFSIVFPAGKLVALIRIWFRPMERERRRRWAGWLEALGKWSMLDGFLVAALVGSIQLRNVVKAASAHPEPAVYFFAMAILLSMVASTLVVRACERESHKARVPQKLGASFLVVPWLAAACLLATWWEPILRVEKKLFVNVYGLPKTTREFFASGEYFLGGLLVLFVMLVPLVYFLSFGWVAIQERRGRVLESWQARLRFLDRWAMVDVFLLALLLVCSKVGRMSTMERLPGFWLILAVAVMSVTCTFGLRRRD